jgi:branched-chain amino acid transport system substrate-binding protein
MRKILIATMLAGALLMGCTAGDDTSSEDTTAGSGTSAGSTPAATGPAPGVTDDSVQIGVPWIDLSAVQDLVQVDYGDFVGAYQALFDDINADGGINGRTLEPVFEPLDPLDSTSADQICVELTEDQPSFIVMGFFVDDAVLCPLETHPTAVIGGEMNPTRLERAQAPWYTVGNSADFENDVIRTMADAGDLDGTLGVIAGAGQENQLNDTILPLLDELGVEVTESGVIDAPPDDVAAQNAATDVIAERFRSSGVDRVLATGPGGLGWANAQADSDYRPQLRLTSTSALDAYVLGDNADLSILDGAVGGNVYGGPANVYDLPAMQDCIGVIEDAGVEVPDPADLGPDDPTTFQAAFTACREVTLLRALLEAAGPELNYGTLVAGADGLEVEAPDDPDPLTYGPPPSADGDRQPYLFDWDPAAAAFVLREG